jgi:hypothetical protein
LEHSEWQASRGSQFHSCGTSASATVSPGVRETRPATATGTTPACSVTLARRWLISGGIGLRQEHAACRNHVAAELGCPNCAREPRRRLTAEAR